MPTAAPRPAFACYSSIRAICAMPSPPPPNRRSISPFSQCLISPAHSAQTTPIPSTRPPPSLSHYRAPQRCILRSSAPSAKACSCCSTISARKGRENVQPDPSDNNRIFPGDITPSNPRICAATLSSPHIATRPATYLNRRKPAGSDSRTPPDSAKKVTTDPGLYLVPDSKITLEDFFRFADRFGQ